MKRMTALTMDHFFSREKLNAESDQVNCLSRTYYSEFARKQRY